MRTAERDALLLLLAITSGSADAWSFLGLGHAFVANMTGNTVLLAISVFSEHHAYFHPLIALVSYAIGVASGTILTRKVTPGSLWSKSTSRVLFLEGLLLVAAELAWMRVAGSPGTAIKSVILACIAVGIGLQSGALLPLKLPGIITTYITGTWTTLVSGIALISDGHVPDKTKFEERAMIQIMFLVVYFSAAVATGWILRYMPATAGIICSCPILLAAAYGTWRGRNV